MMTIHHKVEEDDAIDVDSSLVDFLVSEECSDFVYSSMNNKAEQFLSNDVDDGEIIDETCSDEGVG